MKINILNFYKIFSSKLQNIFRTRFQTDMYISQVQVVSKTHEKVFVGYKNKYNNRELAIIATGPSLKKYNPISHTINIGINDAIMYNKIELDYFFTIDRKAIDKNEEVLNRASHITKFYGVVPFHPYGLRESTSNATISESTILKHNANKFYVYSKRPVLPVVFTPDIDKTWLVDGDSSTFSAMQFALFTNPKKIYLVGCDCSSGYFDGKGGNNATPFIKVWKELKKFADTYYPETEIISVNPVGLRGLFKDWDQE